MTRLADVRTISRFVFMPLTSRNDAYATHNVRNEGRALFSPASLSIVRLGCYNVCPLRKLTENGRQPPGGPHSPSP